MNVLIFVFAVLMLLASMSYMSIQQLKQSLHTHTEYRRYLQADVEGKVLDSMTALYDASTVSQGNPSSEKKKRLKPKLKLPGLMQPDLRSEQNYELSVEILKRLITELYQKHRFYQEMLLRKAAEQGLNEEQVIAKLVASVSSFGELPPDMHSISTDKDLVKVQIDDIVLRNAFAKMLNGRSVPLGERGGYPSLLDYISIQGSGSVSLYLAKPAMLRAVFQDSVAVERVMEGRMEIYRQLRNDPPLIDKTDGEERLRSLVGGSSIDSSEKSPFDFSVSTTRPPNTAD